MTVRLQVLSTGPLSGPEQGRTPNLNRTEITSQQHLYTPSPASPPHLTRSLPTSRTELSSELQPPEKEAVASDREATPELEEHPGMVGPGIRLEKSSDRLGMFFFPSQFALWDSKKLLV
jgi:hypothetical protein